MSILWLQKSPQDSVIANGKKELVFKCKPHPYFFPFALKNCAACNQVTTLCYLLYSSLSCHLAKTNQLNFHIIKHIETEPYLRFHDKFWVKCHSAELQSLSGIPTLPSSNMTEIIPTQDFAISMQLSWR